MPGTVIGKSLNLGFTGKISRNSPNTVGARMVKSIVTAGAETLSAIPFGKFAVLNTDNTVSLFGQSGSGVSAATLANLAGVAVGEVKQMTTYGSVSAAGQFEPGEAADILQYGSCTVSLPTAGGTPVAGETVYLVTAAGTALKVGEIATTAAVSADSATAIALTGVKFTTGKVDANGVCEITLTVRVNP